LGGTASAKTIAKHVQADRSEIYRAIIELEKIGLVQRYITNPVTFKAAPITEAFAILLQQKAEKHNQIQTEAEKFIKKFRELDSQELSREDSKYRVTSGSKVEDRELSRDLSKIQTSSDIIVSWRVRLFGLNRHFEQYKEALERGVKMRCITHIPENEETPPIIQILKETGHFEIKSASTNPKAGIDILDKKSVHIMTFPNGDVNEIEVLRSKNPALVELLQDYFDMKWQTATTPRWRKKTTKRNPTSRFAEAQ
jgi:sugar-specific transcriptional regulator TrmB